MLLAVGQALERFNSAGFLLEFCPAKRRAVGCACLSSTRVFPGKAPHRWQSTSAAELGRPMACSDGKGSLFREVSISASCLSRLSSLTASGAEAKPS